MTPPPRLPGTSARGETAAERVRGGLLRPREKAVEPAPGPTRRGGTARQGARPARRGGPARRRGVCVRVCVGVEGTGFEVSDEGRLPSVMFLPGALDLALGKHANKFN